jgi:hypothetical protein
VSVLSRVGLFYGALLIVLIAVLLALGVVTARVPSAVPRSPVASTQ